MRKEEFITKVPSSDNILSEGVGKVWHNKKDSKRKNIDRKQMIPVNLSRQDDILPDSNVI